MGDSLIEVFGSLTWRGLLIGLLIFVVTFVVNLAIVSFILVKLPADHFSKNHRTSFWFGRHPAIRATGIIGKNILGVLLVVVGILLSIPGVPGQGLLTILLGIMLLDFPGKRRLEQNLLSRPQILKTINRLRARFGKQALEIDQ
jgi:ABC-type phosphate transport system permease subunit